MKEWLRGSLGQKRQGAAAQAQLPWGPCAPHITLVESKWVGGLRGYKDVSVRVEGTAEFWEPLLQLPDS